MAAVLKTAESVAPAPRVRIPHPPLYQALCRIRQDRYQAQMIVSVPDGSRMGTRRQDPVSRPLRFGQQPVHLGGGVVHGRPDMGVKVLRDLYFAVAGADRKRPSDLAQPR